MNSTNSLALIIISGALFFLFGKPMIGEIGALRASVAAYDQAIADTETIEIKKAELLDKLESLPPALVSKVETFLPEEAGLVKLVADIDGIAGKHGISIADIGTAPVSSDRGVTAVDEAPALPDYHSTYINFRFKADYTHLKSFLKDLEASLRLLDIRSIDVEKGTTGVYNYSVSAETYWLSKNPAQSNEVQQ